MPINDAQKRDLTDLRAAATQRQHEQLQYYAKRLLGQLDYFVALAVVMERVYGFLDIFESYYPDEAWVRAMLVGITSFGIAPDDSTAAAALEQSFITPGAGNYIKAIFDVTQAMQKRHTSEARISFMTSAIENAIMAELAEAWYGERTDDWEQVRANRVDPSTGAFSDPQAAQIAYAFWTDPNTAALDTACWQEVADHLEKQFNRT
jgi:hypothetical protein